MKPWFVADILAPDSGSTLRYWYERVSTATGANPLVLSIGGPRESESPGVYQAASRFLATFFDAINAIPSE